MNPQVDMPLNVQHTIFLREFAKDCGWPRMRSPEKIMERLCEQYWYAPYRDLRIIHIFYGWLWGKDGDSVRANCQAAILDANLRQAYDRVATRYNWDK